MPVVVLEIRRKVVSRLAPRYQVRVNCEEPARGLVEIENTAEPDRVTSIARDLLQARFSPGCVIRFSSTEYTSVEDAVDGVRAARHLWAAP